MNWITTLIAAAIVVLVPTALAATFYCFRDTHGYHAHYTKSGFSPEASHDREQAREKARSHHDVSELESQENVDKTSMWPVSDWPSEL